MIHELTTNKDNLRPLITNFEHRPVLESLVEGSSSGRIFVDDLTTPRSAIVWISETEGELLFYFLGESNNTNLIRLFDIISTRR